MFLETEELNSDVKERAAHFLIKIKPVLSTNDCKFVMNAKNQAFSRRFPLKHEAKVAIIRSLVPEDCIAVEPNDNPRYSESEVYKFLKKCILPCYGEEESVELYIKMYLCEEKTYDYVIVISLHESGMYE